MSRGACLQEQRCSLQGCCAAAHPEAVANAGGDLADAGHLVVQLLELRLGVLQLGVHFGHLRLRSGQQHRLRPAMHEVNVVE